MENEQYRRPVAVAPESAAGRLVIVCDDGSIWKWFDDGNRWEELTPVPGSRRAAAGPRPLPGSRGEGGGFGEQQLL
jgi:hypothetical protein